MGSADGQPGRHAYGDSGYYNEVIGNSSGLAARLKELLSGSPVLQSRLMYGTDWLMNCGEAGIKSYRKDFEKLMQDLEQSAGKTEPTFRGSRRGSLDRMRPTYTA